MNKSKLRSTILAYILIIVGTGVLAISIQCFYDPFGLVTGGFTGLAILIKALTAGIVKGGIPLWLTNLALNIPVFILAYVFIGKKFVGRTIVGAAMLSVWLYIIPSIDIAQGDELITAVFGAVFSGGGIGIVLRGNATTGGTDMVAAIIQKKILKHYSIAQIMLFLDGAIVAAGAFKFGIKSTLYAIIAIFITTKVSDTILEGFNFSKAAYIITSKHEDIAQVIMKNLDRGVTGLHAQGMYTHNDKLVLYCVVPKQQIVQLKDIVADIDSDAFVIVSDVREVYGEGFKQYGENI